MNVTSNGYYSSNYLKNRERYGRRYYEDSESGSDWGNMMMNDEGEYSFNDYDEDYESHDEEPTKLHKITEIKPKSILKLSGGSNHPNSGVKQNARFTSDIENSSISTVTEPESRTTGSAITHSTKSPLKSVEPTPTVSDDPDYLVEGMTPAQLINQQNSSYSYYDNRRGYYQQPYQNRNPYYRTNSGSAGGYSGGNIIGNGSYMSPPRKRKEKKVIYQFNPDDHYIKQQRRYDSSTYKPTMYRHKTFRDVFDDENKLERQAEYNPMEFVFQAPASEQKNDKNIRKTFKSLTGKKDYNDLDYYEQQELERKLKEEKIAAEERRERELSEKVYLNESEELELKQRRKKLKILKFGNMLKFGKKKVVPVVDIEGDALLDGEGSVFVKNTDGLESLVSKKALQDKASTADLVVDEAGNEMIVHSKAESVLPGDASVKSRRSEKTARSEKVHHVVPANNIPIGANANPNFTWWWNYILSWIVYDREVEDEASIHDAKSYVGTTKSGKSSKSKKSSSTALVATPKTDIAQEEDVHEELSPWKKIKRIPKNTRTTWQALQQPADLRFIKGGWSAAVEAVERNQAEQEALQGLAADGHSIVTYPRSSRTGTTIYDYDPDSKELEVEMDADTVLEELYFNPINGDLGVNPPSLYNSLSPTILSPGEETGPVAIISNIASTIKGIKIMRILFAPIDVIGETFPNLQTVVIMVELIIFVWILYELSLLVDALCMMVKAVCAPMIAVGKFMNKIM